MPGLLLPTFAAVLVNGYAQSADKFADTIPIPPLAVSQIDVPFTDGDERGGHSGAFFTYDGRTLTLHYAPEMRADMEFKPGWSDHRFMDLTVYSDTVPIGSYWGRNAYGVRAKVQRYRTRIVRVGYDDGKGYTGHGVKFTVAASGAEAKAIAANSVVRVTLGSLDVQQPAPCEHVTQEPTISNPEEYDRITCTINADVRSIAIVRKDTGEVLTSRAVPKTAP